MTDEERMEAEKKSLGPKNRFGRWLDAHVENPLVKWPLAAALALICFTLIVGAIWGYFWVLIHIVAPAFGPWPALAIVVVTCYLLFFRKRR
jgi:hypothetical protein